MKRASYIQARPLEALKDHTLMLGWVALMTCVSWIQVRTTGSSIMFSRLAFHSFLGISVKGFKSHYYAYKDTQ